MEVEGSLVITQLDEDDDAKYQCLAKNVVGTRGSAKAQLSILGKYSLCPHCLKITQNIAFEFFEFWHFPPILSH